MQSSVVARLQCPHCHGGLVEAEAGSGRALRCEKGHSFDIARQGYANLAGVPPAHSGDTAEMVAARVAFQTGGHFRIIAEAVADAAERLCHESQPDLIVEAGAGTGYYLGIVLDAFPASAGLALDVSKAALRRASQTHPRAGAALCDVWRELPVSDGAAGLILSIFAPRNGAEFLRVLGKDGVLVVVTPTAAHLQELIGPLGLLSVAQNKDEALAASLTNGFVQAGEKRLDVALHLSHNDVRALVAMGPSAWHIDSKKLGDAIKSLPETMQVTASVQIGSYRRRVE